MMNVIFAILSELMGRAVVKTFVNLILPGRTSTKPSDDPVYKKNVQDLIERNRRFEKSE